MGQSLIKDYKRVFSQPGGDPSLATRVSTLENNEYKITYFESVSAASGTVTKPTGSTILLDQFTGGIDAYVTTIVNGQPTGILPQTSGGVAVDVSSFNSSGDWVLTGTPSAYPVAIIYVIKISALNYANLVTTNVITEDPIDVYGYPLVFGSGGAFAPADSTDYVFGQTTFNIPVVHAAYEAVARGVPVPATGTIKSFVFTVAVYSVNGSAENATLVLERYSMAKSLLSSTTLSTTIKFNPGGATPSNHYSATGLSIAVNSTDILALKLTTPAWATNPTGIFMHGNFYIE